jgi:hypothetical protein
MKERTKEKENELLELVDISNSFLKIDLSWF